MKIAGSKSERRLMRLQEPNSSLGVSLFAIGGWKGFWREASLRWAGLVVLGRDRLGGKWGAPVLLKTKSLSQDWGLPRQKQSRPFITGMEIMHAKRKTISKLLG
jgi:hypothetical protein